MLTCAMLVILMLMRFPTILIFIIYTSSPELDNGIFHVFFSSEGITFNGKTMVFSLNVPLKS